MVRITQAAFYKRVPGEIESILNDVISVVNKIGLSHSWAGDPPETPGDIGLRDRLVLHADDKQIRIGFETDEQTDEGLTHFLNASTPVSNFPAVDESNDQYRGFVATFVDLIRQLSVTLEPDYVGIPHPDTDVGPSPLEVMPTEVVFEIERLPWLSVYSPSLIDQFGWTDRISDAPAWKTEQLDTGAFLLIKTKDPWADVSRDHPLDRYLLDGEEQ